MLLQKRLKLHRQHNYYREKSAYLKVDADVDELLQYKRTELRLPHIPTGAPISPEGHMIPERSGRWGYFYIS